MIGESDKKIESGILRRAKDRLADFLVAHSVGIDISDHSMEIVEIIKESGRYRLNANRVELPEGLVQQGRIVDEKKLSKVLKDTLGQARPNRIVTERAVFGLPESQVYSHVFSKTETDLATLARWEAQTAIPLPFDDQLYCYKLIENKLADSGKANEVLLLSISKTVALEWCDFFKKNGITLLILDFEPIARYRGLVEKTSAPVCIVDIGFEQTIYSVIDGNNLYYSFSFKYAGEAITDKFVSEAKNAGMGMERSEADEFKRAKGVASKEPAVKFLNKAIHPILKEIKNAVTAGEERSGQAVSQIILTGETASIPGLVEYVDSKLNIAGVKREVLIGTSKKIGNAVLNAKLSAAAGLALRVMDGGLSDVLTINGPLALAQKKQTQKKKAETAVGPQKEMKLFDGHTRKRRIKLLFLIAIILLSVLFISKSL